MIENIIFGIMVVVALGAGVFTCIYEAGGTSKSDNSNTEIKISENSHERN
jgi:hypothetical protein